MSQRTHRPKETKRDRFNDLLTSFGKEIKDWATGKTKVNSLMLFIDLFFDFHNIT